MKNHIIAIVTLIVATVVCSAEMHAQENPPVVVDTLNNEMNVNPANPNNYSQDTVLGEPRNVTPTPAPTTPNNAPKTAPGAPDTTPGIPPSNVPSSPNTVPSTTPSGSPTKQGVPKGIY